MIDNTKLYINKNVYIEMVGFFLIISLKGILNFLLCPFILFSEKKKYYLFLNENDISITIALELYRRSSKAIVIRVIFIKLWFQFFPFRWFHAHEFFYEEIETLVFSVAFAHAVPYAR